MALDATTARRPPRQLPPRSASTSWNPVRWAAKLRGPATALVCTFDGVTLRGAVATRDGPACTLSPAAASTAAEPVQAVREVINALARQGIAVPLQACLATPQAVPGFLDLGVDPAKPRPAREMAELVRWDMEAELAANTTAWTVADILVLRGDLTRKQAAALLEEAALDGPQGASATGRRAAEMAVEQGLLGNEAVTSANRQLSRMTASDEVTMCAWLPPPGRAGGKADWFCTAIGAAARDEWRTAFAEAGHRLNWLYPATGITALPLPHGQDNARELVLEVHPAMLAALSLRSGRITSLHAAPLRGAEPKTVAAGLIAKAGESQPDRITALSPDGPAAAIRQALAENWTMADAPEEPLAGLAQHALGLAGAAAMPRIAAADPPPPLWRNPDAVRIGAVCLALLTLISVEATMRWRIAASRAHLAQLEREADAVAQHDHEIQQQVTEARAKDAERTEANGELVKLRADLNVIKNVLVVRERLVPRLLTALQHAVNDDVFLNSVTETGLTTGNFEIRGWGMTDTAIHLFTTRLERDLGGLSLRISDGEEMRRGRDRLDIDGYLFSVRLTRADPVPPAVPAAAPPARSQAPAKPAVPPRPRARR